MPPRRCNKFARSNFPCQGWGRRGSLAFSLSMSSGYLWPSKLQIKTVIVHSFARDRSVSRKSVYGARYRYPVIAYWIHERFRIYFGLDSNTLQDSIWRGVFFYTWKNSINLRIRWRDGLIFRRPIGTILLNREKWFDNKAKGDYRLRVYRPLSFEIGD